MSTFSSFLTKEPRWALYSEFPKLFRFPSLIVKIRFRISRRARPAYLTVSHGEGEALTINSQTLSCRLVFHLVTSAKERKKPQQEIDQKQGELTAAAGNIDIRGNLNLTMSLSHIYII